MKTAVQVMSHPIQAMEDVKYEGSGSITLALGILILFFATSIIQRQWTGFPFNGERPDKIHLGIILMSTVGLYMLWVISNIAVSSFMGGEGKGEDVMIASAYSLQPYILLTLAAVVLSNVMTLETGVFLSFVQIAAVGWSVVAMTVSLMTVHQFTFKRTLANLLATLISMLVIAFLGSLIFSLFQQLYVFCYTIFNEIIFRM